MQDATSINQLAKRCGVTHRAAGLWLKHPKFPVQREAPWSADDIEEIQSWRSTTLQPNRASPDYQGRVGVEPPADEQSKDYWLMRKYRAQALEAEGRLLDVDVVRKAWVATMSEIRQRCLLIAPTAAAACAGRPAPECEKIIDEQLRRALDDIADRVGDVTSAGEDHRSGAEGDPDAPPAEAE